MDRVRAVLAGWKFWPSRPNVPAVADAELLPVRDVEADTGFKAPQIEEYAAGYPQYSALISHCDFFFAFRSFRQLRARLLLSKQDEIAALEAQLDRLDSEEASPFFLGTCRGDRNADRAATFEQMHTKLTEYDGLMSRTRQILSYNHVAPRDISSLRNWLEKQGCLVENETRYLERENDMISLASSNDLAMKQLEDWIEDQLIQYWTGFRSHPGFDASADSDVYIYSGSLIKAIARVLMLFLVTFLLLTPVVVCILVDSIAARILIIVISTAFYLTVLSRLTKSRMIELILAGATFATVLTVFVSNSS